MAAYREIDDAMEATRFLLDRHRTAQDSELLVRVAENQHVILDTLRELLMTARNT